jgi:hypothetical protein
MWRKRKSATNMDNAPVDGTLQTFAGTFKLSMETKMQAKKDGSQRCHCELQQAQLEDVACTPCSYSAAVTFWHF